MKTIFFIFGLIAWAHCGLDVPIVRQSIEVNPEVGTYNYLYETGNSIYEDKQGYPKDTETLAAQGQFQYVAPDGQVIRLNYVADENGFQPQGEHLPTPPPIPPQISKALEWIAKNPPPPPSSQSNRRF